jgi:hypothetical protein
VSSRRALRGGLILARTDGAAAGRRVEQATRQVSRESETAERTKFVHHSAGLRLVSGGCSPCDSACINFAEAAVLT